MNYFFIFRTMSLCFWWERIIFQTCNLIVTEELRSNSIENRSQLDGLLSLLLSSVLWCRFLFFSHAWRLDFLLLRCMTRLMDSVKGIRTCRNIIIQSAFLLFCVFPGKVIVVNWLKWTQWLCQILDFIYLL